MTASRHQKIIDRMRAEGGLAALHPAASDTKPALPAEETLAAGFIGLNLSGYRSEEGWKSKLRDGIWHERSLMFKIDRETSSVLVTAPEARRRTSFVSLDLKTSASREIAFPDLPTEIPFTGSDRPFDFSADSLYVGDKDKIYRYRFARAEWEAIPVPIQRAGQVVVVSGHVFISTAENLLELDPETRNISLIASSRRRPPENQMDTNWDPRVGVYARADGKLGALFGTTLHSIDFDPANRAWENLTDTHIPRPDRTHGQWLALFYSPVGALALLSGAPNVPHRLLEFRYNEAAPATLLADTNWERQVRDTNLTALTPRWVWPKEFPMDTSFFAGDGTSLWILTPRKFWYGPSNGIEQVEFTDSRQATLFHFIPEIRAPMSVPIRFENSSPACDPLDSPQSGLAYQSMRVLTQRPNLNLLFLDTPESLILAVPNIMGHWRIPKSSLQARFDAQKKSLPIEARTAASQTHRPTGTNAPPP
jgi:hypothetical protein